MKRKFFSLILTCVIAFSCGLSASAEIFTPGDDLFIGQTSGPYYPWGVYGLNILGGGSSPVDPGTLYPLQWLIDTIADNVVDDSTTNSYNALITSAGNTVAFNGADEYAEGPNTGLGASDFYYEYRGLVGTTAHATSSDTIFSDGGSGSGGIRTTVAVWTYSAPSKLIRYVCDDDVHAAEYMTLTVDYSATDEILVKFWRTNNTATAYFENVTQGTNWSDTASFTYDYSSTQPLTLDCTKDASTDAIGSYCGCTPYRFKAGTTSTNITHQYEFVETRGLTLFDTVGTNHLYITTPLYDDLWTGDHPDSYFVENGGSKAIWYDQLGFTDHGTLDSNSAVSAFIDYSVGGFYGATNLNATITNDTLVFTCNGWSVTNDVAGIGWTNLQFEAVGDYVIGDDVYAIGSSYYSGTNGYTNVQPFQVAGVTNENANWAWLVHTNLSTVETWDASDAYGSTIPSTGGTNDATIGLSAVVGIANVPAKLDGSNDALNLGIRCSADIALNTDYAYMAQTNSALANNYYWNDGTSWVTNSGTEYYAHSNFLYNVIVSGESPTKINDIITYAPYKLWTEEEYEDMVDWLADENSTVPIYTAVTNDSGYLYDSQTNITFLNPVQWLNESSTPTNVLDQTINDLDAIYVDSPCLDLAGTETLSLGRNMTGISITTNMGTTTLSWNDQATGVLDVTAGTLWDMEFSDGSLYPCQENGSVILFEAAGITTQICQVVGGTEALYRAGTQGDSHDAIFYGYSLYKKSGSLDMYVPYDRTGSPISASTYGPYTKSFDRPAMTMHNGAPASIQQLASTTELTNNAFWYLQADVLGSELVTEGDFGSGGANWNPLGESTVNTGVGRCYSSAGAGSGFYQNIGLVSGTNYRITYDVTASNDLGVYLYGVTTTPLPIPVSVGSHSINGVADGATANLYFANHLGSACDVSFDNVSVKELITEAGDPLPKPITDFTTHNNFSNNVVVVGATNGLSAEYIPDPGFDSPSDWTAGTGWSVANSKASHVATGAGNLSDSVTLIDGDYITTAVASGVSAGSCDFIMSGVTNFSITASGTYTSTDTYSAGFSIFRFSADASFVGSIESVSVKRMENGYIKEVLTWDVDKQWTPYDYSYTTNWLSEMGSDIPILVPFEVESGGIGPDGTWFSVDDAYIGLFVNPE